MLMPGRKYKAGSGSYRYSLNGQEKETELNESITTALYWEYDGRIGRRWNVDPLAHQFPEMSPYAVFNNNSNINNDPKGASTKSIHIDEKGNVLLNKKDGDNSVFVHNGGTKASVVKDYSAKDHSAGGKKIGELGGNVNLNGIMDNILKDHRSQMVNSPAPIGSWFDLVLPSDLPGRHPWDLKGNKKTIFGVAWEFDEKQKGKPHTSFTFTFDNILNLEFSSAADVGNFHAGYTGMYAGVPVAIQRISAGLGEKAKNLKDGDTKNLFGNSIWPAPFGDKVVDYYWNNLGMVAGDYDQKIKAAINPKPRYNIPPTYNDATHLKSLELPH
jgi:hypothetical protein